MTPLALVSSKIPSSYFLREEYFIDLEEFKVKKVLFKVLGPLSISSTGEAPSNLSLLYNIQVAVARLSFLGES